MEQATPGILRGERPTPVCALEDVTPGAARIVTVGGREIGLFNVEGRIYAVRNSCPHRAAPLCLGRLSGTTLPSEPYDYIYGRAGLVLRCPWHGWEFDLTTGEPLVTHGLRAKTYRVEIVNGLVTLYP